MNSLLYIVNLFIYLVNLCSVEKWNKVELNWIQNWKVHPFPDKMKTNMHVAPYTFHGGGGGGGRLLCKHVHVQYLYTMFACKMSTQVSWVIIWNKGLL